MTTATAGTEQPDDTEFDGLIQQLIDRACADSPRMAEVLGIDGFADQLGDFSAEAHRQRDRADTEWLGRFTRFDLSRLSPAQRIDRELIISQLSSRVALADSGWAEWRRTAEGYLETGITGMFLAARRSEEATTDAAVARLAALPAVLDSATANLDPDLCDPLIVQRSLAEARANTAFALMEVAGYAADPQNQARLLAAGAAAGEAYERFGHHLESLLARATGSFAFGVERYNSVLATRELLDLDTAELTDLGWSNYHEIVERMTGLSRSISGSPDWVACCHELQRVHAPTIDAMRDEYATATESARTFALDQGLIASPDDEVCVVGPAPMAVRAVLSVACYVAPPLFGGTRTGHFFVPYPTDDNDEESVAGLLESNASYVVASTAVHEAYPGHHWHLMTAKDARPVRKIYLSDYFAEGWALYCEGMMARAGFYTPAQEMGFLEGRLFRAARIIVDVGLHTGTMSVADAVAFMHDRAMMPAPTARSEVARYCAWPTQASSYLTGALRIEQAAQAWIDAGRHLGEFHNRIVRMGSMPVPLALASMA